MFIGGTTTRIRWSFVFDIIDIVEIEH